MMKKQEIIMVWLIENYPASAETMKKNPDYQYRFK